MSSVLPMAARKSLAPDSGNTTPPELACGMSYRSDIDGMRGIAVLSVLGVHAFPQWVKGGFIGVDIFFVLSGYLIAGIVFQALDSGRFSYLDFYARRIKRIFPALLLVLATCLVFSALFTFPAEARQVGKHIGAGAVFLSNLTLWSEAGYFDASSDAKPLLHLWSLGIEEQFYLLWPLAAVACVRYRRWALPMLLSALLVSFLLNVAWVVDKPKATFFLLPMRAWELLIGTLLAYWTLFGRGGPVPWLRRQLREGSTAHRCAADGFAWAGLSMLVVALWLIDKTDDFPGWWALLPTCGTFALLAAGPHAWINRQLLSHPILRFYGLISYPLYLWHWPLLSFPVMLGIELTNDVRVMILIASVVLAALTYELIEKPIRFGKHTRNMPLLLCAAMAVIGLSGLLLQKTDGLLNSYPPSMQSIASTPFRFDYSDYRIDKCMLRLDQGPERFSENCIEPRESSHPLLLLWGDSHAASLYPGLVRMLASDPQAPGLGQYTAARCPPLLSTPLLASRDCERINTFVLGRIAALRPHTVVLAGNWILYGAEEIQYRMHMASLRDTVDRLHEIGVQRVLVFGQMPVWTMPQPRILLTAWAQSRTVPPRTHEHIDRTSLAMDNVVESALKGSRAEFVSPVRALCDDGGCLTSTATQGVFEPIAFDESHLTAAGSTILVHRARQSLVPLMATGVAADAARWAPRGGR